MPRAPKAPGHTINRPHGWGSSNRHGQLPGNWASLRKACLERDRHRCRIRGPECLGRATDADHIGDRHDHQLTNLQAACRPCHQAKTIRERAR